MPRPSPPRGQVIVEAMIALSVLVTGFLGISALLSRSLSLNRVSADNYTATYLAAEGIEVVKSLIDSNILHSRPWNQGFTSGFFELEWDTTWENGSLQASQDRFLRFNPGTGRFSYSEPVVTTFRRRVEIMLVDSEEMRVNSVVTWITRGGGSFSVNLEDHFLNWRP